MSFELPPTLVVKLRENNNERSMKTVVNRIKRLFKVLGSSTYDPSLLTDPVSVGELLRDKIALSSSLEAVVRALKLVVNHEFADNKKLLKTYKRMHIKVLDEYSDKTDYAPASEADEAKYLPWAQILEIRERWKVYAHDPSAKPKEAFFNRLKYFLCTLYTEIPPLRGQEYCDMFFTKELAGMSDELAQELAESKATNYWDLESQRLVIGQHKTVGSHGGKVIKWRSAELTKALSLWREVNHTDRVVVGYKNDKKMQVAGLAGHLRSIFAPKDISTSTLRKIYISEVASTKSMAIQRDIARKMGHKLTTAKARYARYKHK